MAPGSPWVPWAHGSPWAQWVPMGPWPMGQIDSHSGQRGPKKSMLPGPRGPKKVEIYKNSGNPGLNHEPLVVFFAEFESGIGNGWNVDENLKHVNFEKIEVFNFLNFIFNSSPVSPGAF